MANKRPSTVSMTSTLSRPSSISSTQHVVCYLVKIKCKARSRWCWAEFNKFIEKEPFQNRDKCYRYPLQLRKKWTVFTYKLCNLSNRIWYERIYCSSKFHAPLIAFDGRSNGYYFNFVRLSERICPFVWENINSVRAIALIRACECIVGHLRLMICVCLRENI